MRGVFTILVIIGLVGIIITPSVFSQEDNRFSRQDIERATSDIDLTKTKVRPRLRRSILDSLDSRPNTASKPPSSLGLGSLLTWLAYISIGALILLILYLLFANIDVDDKLMTPIIPAEHLVENIDHIDPNALYAEAVKRGDYRTALRMQFLIILKNLSDHRKIKWKINKTNHDYSMELRSTDYYQSFKMLVSIYDWVWYGKREIDEKIFTDLNKPFDAFIRNHL